ncbi:MAG: Cyclic di-GMP phosphodiesterase response regulator RpfG [Spirochaetes bacterium ADurb.Bin269]|nr:MAG: Cyclic di-GMP phosphodiesterase response regulator RpfG [Spirochaetes bacterium ADurb.Bin269]
MIKKSRVRAVALLLVVSCPLLFAVDDELVTRYLTAANNQYSAGNVAKAFAYINNVLSSYADELVPQNVEVLSETIYYGYLEELKKSRDWKAFAEVKGKLIEFPYVSSERIARSVKVLNTYEAQDAAWGGGSVPSGTGGPDGAVQGSGAVSGSAAAAAAIYNNQLKSNVLELQLALEKMKAEAAAEAAQEADAQNAEFQQELLATQREAYERALAETRDVAGSSSRVLLLSLLILTGLILIVFIAVIVNVLINLRNTKSQNDKFVETLKAVSEMTQLNMTQRVQLDALPPLYGADSQMRMIGSAMKETGLPSPPITEAEKKELADLAQKCREIGAKIDAATGRKNNSKNVAEMVFKLAQEMGVAQYEATLFFSVAMVYDIGFLEVDASLLQATNLTEDQKFEIRNHVKQGLAALSFVPEKYMSVFADGVLMHHENMDGSGYPEGLSGSRIPYIARLIRVAESFVALISRRNYRDIFDKESAVAELRSSPGLYDSEIVDVLETII